MTVNWVDWTILAIVSISIVIGVARGFIREVMSLVVWVAAVVLSMMFYLELAPSLGELISTQSLRLLTAWLAIFVSVLIVGGLINYLLSKLIEVTGLSGTDRLLGVVFGAARGFLLVLAVLMFLPDILPVDQDPWWRESALIPEFLKFENWAKESALTVADFFKRLF